MPPFKLRKSKKNKAELRRDGLVLRDPKLPSLTDSDDVSERTNSSAGLPVQNKQSAEMRPADFINRGPGFSNTSGGLFSSMGTPNLMNRQLPMIPTAGQSLSPEQQAQAGISPVGGSAPKPQIPPKPLNPFAPVGGMGPSMGQGQPTGQVHNPGQVPTSGPIPGGHLASQLVAPPQAIEKFTPWTRIKLQNLPFPRYRHTSLAVILEEGHVFVMGGLREGLVYGDLWAVNLATYDANLIENFDGIPAPRVGHNSCLCGNAFIIFGGDTIQTNEMGELDNDLYLFNINLLKWTIPHPQGPRPCGRYGHTIGVIAKTNAHSKLYLFGGQLDLRVFSDLWVFDLTLFKKTPRWEEVRAAGDPANAPPPLTNHTMVVFNYKLYIFGGLSLNHLLNELYCYDPSVNSWSRKQCSGDVPPPVEEHSATLIKHLMIVYGGKNQANETQEDLYVLNLNLLVWTRIEKFMLHPGPRCGHSVLAMFNYHRKGPMDLSDARFNNIQIVPTKVLNNAVSLRLISQTKNKILIMGGDQLDYCSGSPTSFERLAKDEGAGTMLYLFDLDTYNDWLIKFKGIDLWSDKPRPITALVPIPAQPQQAPVGSMSAPSNTAPQFEKEVHSAGRNLDLLDTYVNLLADLLDRALKESPVKPSPPPASAPGPLPARLPKRDDPTRSPARNVSPAPNISPSRNSPVRQNSHASSTGLPAAMSPNTADMYVSAISELPQDRLIDKQLGSLIDRAEFSRIVALLESELTLLKNEMNEQAKSALDRVQELESQIEILELQKDDDRIRALEQELAEKTKIIHDLESGQHILHAHEQEIEEHKRALQETEQELEKHKKASEEKSILLEDHGSEVGALLDSHEKALQDKDDLLSKHKKALEEKDDLLLQHKELLSAKDELLQQHVAALSEKDEIHKQSLLEREQQYEQEKKELLSKHEEEIQRLLSQHAEEKQILAQHEENSSKVQDRALEILPNGKTQSEEVESLRDEVQQKENVIAELRAALANATAASPQIGDPTNDEVEALRSQLVEKEKIIQELAAGPMIRTSSPLRDDGSPEMSLNALRRENIELNLELIRLRANNDTLTQKFNEFEPLMSNLMFELDKLNGVIQHQQNEIDALTEKAQSADALTEEISKLRRENELLKHDLEGAKTTRQAKRSLTNEKISSISTDLNRLVTLWKTKKEVTMDLDRSLILDDSLSETTATGDDDFGNRSMMLNMSTSSNSRAFAQLNGQINELILINKEQEATNNELQNKVQNLMVELEDLKKHAGKSDELEKLEENYRNAMNLVKKSGRALDMSQKELNKQRELNNSLRAELEELRLERGTIDNGADEGDDDLKNAHYDFKIKDLEAELFIIKQERDELKDSVLQLRKKLINGSK